MAVAPRVWTTQSAVTVMAEILPGHEAAVRELLATAAQNPADNDLVPFGQLATVHFARFFVIDAAVDLDGRQMTPRLIFLADVDGPGDALLMALASLGAAGLTRLYAHTQGAPSAATLLAFLRAHSIPTAATYVNTIGRTVAQIHQEAALRTAIQGYLDRTRDEWRAATPRRVRAGIQEFVESEPTLAWARQRAPAPDPSYLFGEKLHIALVGVAGIVLFPLLLLGLPVWLYFLRRSEKTDPARDVIPSDEWVDTLATQEDHGVQNPFTSAGFVKPGPLRRFTSSLVLWGTNFLTRHVFNHASLIGVKTIHFARWIFIDQQRRVIFCSNYDGSLESYMDDFIDKIAWGLNASFSNGVDFPRTNWLFLDGANDELTFKRFNVNHQLVSPFWYAAYQGLTALNIDNNAEVRAGLYGALDDAQTRVWLQRL